VTAGSVEIVFRVVQYASSSADSTPIVDKLNDPSVISAFNATIEAATGLAVESSVTIDSTSSFAAAGVAAEVVDLRPLSPGAIAGLAFGSGVGALLLAVAGLACGRKRGGSCARGAPPPGRVPRGPPVGVMPFGGADYSTTADDMPGPPLADAAARVPARAVAVAARPAVEADGARPPVGGAPLRRGLDDSAAAEGTPKPPPAAGAATTASAPDVPRRPAGEPVAAAVARSPARAVPPLDFGSSAAVAGVIGARPAAKAKPARALAVGRSRDAGPVAAAVARPPVAATREARAAAATANPIDRRAGIAVAAVARPPEAVLRRKLQDEAAAAAGTPRSGASADELAGPAMLLCEC
jgi:hypothetical protein